MISVTSRRLILRAYGRVRFIGISKPTRSNERNWWDKIIYSKTYEVGHTFTEQANSYGITRGRYSVTWPFVYSESWPQFHVLCFAVCVSSSSPWWPTWRVVEFLGGIRHSLSELPCAYSASVLSSQVWTVLWSFLLATELLHDLKGPCSLTGLCTCLQIGPPDSPLWTVNLHTW